MEKMPFQLHQDALSATHSAHTPAEAASDWRVGLPTLVGATVVLRELCTSDAAALLTMLTSEEVSRFISPPPVTVEGFERFIAWTHRHRNAGQYACFGVVPAGSDAVVGLFQVRALESSFATAEWGFALGSAFWGSGMFVEGAELVLEFAFDVLGVHRLEARAALRNGRGNGALRKIGAVQEGLLRRSLLRNGEYLDQALWAILREEWREATAIRRDRVVFH